MPSLIIKDLVINLKNHQAAGKKKKGVILPDSSSWLEFLAGPCQEDWVPFVPSPPLLTLPTSLAYLSCGHSGLQFCFSLMVCHSLCTTITCSVIDNADPAVVLLFRFSWEYGLGTDSFSKLPQAILLITRG